MLVISIIHLTRNQPPDKKDLSGRQESHPPAKRSHVWTAEVRPLQRRPCVDGRIPTPPKMGLVWTAGFPPLLRWALSGRQDSHPS